MEVLVSMKRFTKEQFKGLTADAGFYIILLICLTVICISGYVLFFTNGSETSESMTMVMPGTGQPIFSAPEGSSILTTPPAVSTVGEEPIAESEEATAPVVDHTEPIEPVVETVIEAVETAVEKPDPIWIRPVTGELLRPFAGETLIYDETMGDWRTHPGVDYAAENGTRVYAISDGTVADVTRDELYGTQLHLTLADGRVAIYRGLAEKVKVKVGERVRAGDVVGTVGADADLSEAALGTHLHLTILDGEIPVDPEAVLSGEARISSAEAEPEPEQPVLGMDDSIPQDGIYTEE